MIELTLPHTSTPYVVEETFELLWSSLVPFWRLKNKDMTNPCVRVLDGDKYLLIIPKGSIFVIKKIEAHTNKKRMFLTIEITNPQYKSISDFKTIPKINIGTWSYNWPDTLKGLKLTQITD